MCIFAKIPGIDHHAERIPKEHADCGVVGVVSVCKSGAASRAVCGFIINIVCFVPAFNRHFFHVQLIVDTAQSFGGFDGVFAHSVADHQYNIVINLGLIARSLIEHE